MSTGHLPLPNSQIRRVKFSDRHTLPPAVPRAAPEGVDAILLLPLVAADGDFSTAPLLSPAGALKAAALLLPDGAAAEVAAASLAAPARSLEGLAACLRGATPVAAGLVDAAVSRFNDAAALESPSCSGGSFFATDWNKDCMVSPERGRLTLVTIANIIIKTVVAHKEGQGYLFAVVPSSSAFVTVFSNAQGMQADQKST
jgi:hypothetical protein